MLDIQGKGDVAKISDIDALIFTTSASAMSNIKDIIAAARNSKIPTAAAIGGGESSGVILTIAADPKEQGTTLAKMVGQAIQGTKPSALPFVQPKKVNMVINLKEATGMGFKVSFDLLSSATKIIK
jgi:putative ABC transport system substrate-binding protein